MDLHNRLVAQSSRRLRIENWNTGISKSGIFNISQSYYCSAQGVVAVAVVVVVVTAAPMERSMRQRKLARKGIWYWDNMMRRKRYDERDEKGNEGAYSLGFMTRTHLAFEASGRRTGLMICFPLHRDHRRYLPRHWLKRLVAGYQCGWPGSGS